MAEHCTRCDEYHRQAALRHGALRGQLRVLVAGWRQQAQRDHFTRAGGYNHAAGDVEDALTADAQWPMPTGGARDPS
jgi:hypothetical protein